MNTDVSWAAQHKENALTMAVFAVCAGGVAWVLGALHVALAFPERFGMALIALFTASYVISDGVEVAIRRLFLEHATVHVVDAESEGAGGTIFSGSEDA